MEEMLITRPQRLAIMDGSAYLVHRNVPVSMTPTSRFHLSTGNSCTGEMNCRPALFTRMSRPPNSRAVAATMVSTSPGRLTSARSGIAWPPAPSISWARVRAPVSCRSHTPTAAPCDASIPAMARPMPLAAPVTIAVLPRRSTDESATCTPPTFPIVNLGTFFLVTDHNRPADDLTPVERGIGVGRLGQRVPPGDGPLRGDRTLLYQAQDRWHIRPDPAPVGPDDTHAPPHHPRDGNRHRGVTRGDPHDDDPPAVADRPKACRIVCGLPSASNATSTPRPPVISMAAGATSSWDASITCVAPTFRAASSLSARTSTAMICAAPHALAI